MAVEAHLHPQPLDHPQPLLPPQADAETQIGLVIISAMTKTTMLTATLMVVTAVEKMSTHNIAVLVNVLKVPLLPLPLLLQQPLRSPHKVVETHNGKVTTSVMMKTTMLDATLMGVTVVVKMSILPIAPTVLA